MNSARFFCHLIRLDLFQHRLVIVPVVLVTLVMLSGCKEDNPFELMQAVGEDQAVSLIWTAPYLEIEQFNLYFSTVKGTAAEGQPITGIPEIDPGSKTGQFTHEGLNNGVTYYYVVTVVTSDGEELGPSKEVSATPYVPPAEAIAERFLPTGQQGEIIQDLGTGLEWQRCSVGQTWNQSEQSCDGDITTMAWEAAMLQSAPGGFSLPSLEQLQTLIVCEEAITFTFGRTVCEGSVPAPDINEDAFPDVTVSRFWSSSTLRGYVPPRSYQVGFVSGVYEGVSYNSMPHAVRLVRESP